jgi:hypothetical protein
MFPRAGVESPLRSDLLGAKNEATCSLLLVRRHRARLNATDDRPCEAITRSGQRCRNPAVAGSRACLLQPHQEQFSSGFRAAREAGVRVNKLLIAVISLGATVLAYLVLLPEISIAPSTEIQKGELQSTPWVISNEGFLPVWEVRFECEPKQLRGRGTVILEDIVLGYRDTIPRLPAGESTSTSCPMPFSRDWLFSSAHLRVSASVLAVPPFLVSWSPALAAKLRWSTGQWHMARPGSDGSIRWLPVGAPDAA